MKSDLIAHLTKTARNLGIEVDTLTLEYPENPEHGDYSSNIAMAHAKVLKMAPKVLAEKIIEEFKKDMPEFVEGVSVAGPGFINFKIKDAVFVGQIVGEEKAKIEKSKEGKKVMVEYTDPNPFKIFHIGHLMSNAVGESISRLVEYRGAEVVRACYQGDVGLHVAKTIYGITQAPGLEEKIKIADTSNKSVTEKVKLLGEAYVYGSTAYEGDSEKSVKENIDAINKQIYTKNNNSLIDPYYSIGRKWSLEYFDLIYKRLGTTFNNFFFESEVAEKGTQIVKDSLKKGVFTESEGAIVFKGEDHGLHTRVFITSHGLPTYETKELGLNTEKFELYPNLDQSVIITANEQSDYFKVVLKAFSFINPEIYSKTKHISHGLLRFASGKMSSRTGNVIPAETLIDEIKTLVKEKMGHIEFSDAEVDKISDQVAIGAIKYTILRQAVGTDVIFDSVKSISFEGDSGPYLQYSVVRARSVLKKADWSIEHSQFISSYEKPDKIGLLERLIIRFPDIVERASEDYAPQQIANYLMNLAGAFNSFYATHVIVDINDPLSRYRIALTEVFDKTMTNGLHLLGIQVPDKM